MKQLKKQKESIRMQLQFDNFPVCYDCTVAPIVNLVFTPLFSPVHRSVLCNDDPP